MGLFSWLKKGVEGTEPSIITQPVEDPLKKAVASPLSKFLTDQISKAMPTYPGSEFGEASKSLLSDYLSVNPVEYFEKNVATPATTRYKRDFLPIVTEGFAGGLRGSGRYRAEEAGINEFSEALAEKEAEFVPEFALKQIAAGLAQDDTEYQRWWATLPSNNPAIAQSLQFLSEGTSSGTTILSALDPGKKGWFWDLLGAAAQAGTTAAMVAA